MDKKIIFQEAGHGGDLLGFAARYGKREDEILDFSSNINPLGPPESLVRLYHESAAELSRYPDAGARPFVQKLSEVFSLFSDQIIAGNGSMELLDLAVRTLRPKRAFILEPSFSEYRKLLEKYNCRVESIRLKPEEDFRPPLEAVLKKLPEAELLILGHPNNPTGTAFTKEEMLFLLQESRRTGTFVLIDEAFADWMPEMSVLPETQKEDNLLVVRSLTKFFALAGLRSGFACGPSNLVRKMKNLQGPWSCNRLAQKLSIAAFEDEDFQIKSRAWFSEEREWFRAALQSVEGLKVSPSRANFFLVQTAHSASALLDSLGKQGIYARRIQEAAGFEDSFLRLAIRTRVDNQRLIEVFHSLSKNLPAGKVS